MYKSIFLALLLGFCSCQSPQEPKTINYASMSDYQNNDILSIRKSRDRDSVKNLYEQAVKKDLQLQELERKISRIYESSKDSLEAYHDFLDYNSMYYISASNYAKEIKDSTMRRNVLKYLAESDRVFRSNTTNHRNLIIDIADLENELDDRHNLMKIIITEGFIQDYQKDSPNLETLENVKHELQDLISSSKTYTKDFD